MTASAIAQKKGKSRILLVDDHPIVRQGLAEMINQEKDLNVCGTAEDVHRALDAIEKLIRRALTEPEKGLGGVLRLSDEAIRWLAETSEGDGRRALTTLENVSLSVAEGETVPVGTPIIAIGEPAAERAESPGEEDRGGHRWRIRQSYGMLGSSGSRRWISSGSCGIDAQLATIAVCVPTPLKPFHTRGGTVTSW